ncbi:MAG: hypothetical protein BWK80_61420 [Desulfobacteraceae bacterium IS3]|nr:MAG: hypothetical protein BWK80_61420 [Desulfobacteraceae bacterium IS3]
MKFPGAAIKIIGEDKCLFYKVGDEFGLSDKAIFSYNGKPICLIFVGDIKEILAKHEVLKAAHRSVSDCSGCTGLIRFECQRRKEST